MSAEPSRLRGITWENPRGYEPLLAATRIWEKEHPGLPVAWEQQPWYEFEQTILSSLERGDGRYDLIMFDHPWVGKLAEERWLLPWDELLGKAFVDSLHEHIVAPSTESYVWEGRQWALPLDAACHAGVYRSDLVHAEDIPADWESLEAWAGKRFRRGAFYPLVLNVEGVLGCCLFLSMMASLDAPAFHDREQPQFEREPAGRVLEILSGLLHYTPPDSHTWGPWDIYDYMGQRQDMGYSPSLFAYVNYFGQEPDQRNLRLMAVPTFQGYDAGRPILGGVGLGIAHTCRHKDFAARYGKLLVSDRIQREVFPRHFGQPAVRSLFADSSENARTHGFYHALSANMASAYIRPRYNGFHAFELKIGAILQRLWNREASIRETLDRMEQLCEQAQDVERIGRGADGSN